MINIYIHTHTHNGMDVCVYIYIYNGILLNRKKEWYNTIYNNMDGPRNYHTNQLNGHEFEQTPGDSEGQGSLACCSSWVGHDLATEQQQQQQQESFLK